MKISIITAVLNGSRVIGDTLRSVRTQDHPDIEHIIVDGASTDDTLQIVQREGTHVAKVVSARDSGVYEALNRGLPSQPAKSCSACTRAIFINTVR